MPNPHGKKYVLHKHKWGALGHSSDYDSHLYRESLEFGTSMDRHANDNPLKDESKSGKGGDVDPSVMKKGGDSTLIKDYSK